MDNYTFSEQTSVGVVLARPTLDGFPLKNTVEAIFRDRYGNITSQSKVYNLRTNVGADFWDAQLFKVAAAGATANYIALTADVTAPAATDTTLTSEIATNGLARAQAADAHTGGTISSTLSKTFTYTGSTSVTVAKVGLFNASSSGTLVLETLLGSSGTVSANGDTIAISWTVNF